MHLPVLVPKWLTHFLCAVWKIRPGEGELTTIGNRQSRDAAAVVWTEVHCLNAL